MSERLEELEKRLDLARQRKANAEEALKLSEYEKLMQSVDTHLSAAQEAKELKHADSHEILTTLNEASGGALGAQATERKKRERSATLGGVPLETPKIEELQVTPRPSRRRGTRVGSGSRSPRQESPTPRQRGHEVAGNTARVHEPSEPPITTYPAIRHPTTHDTNFHTSRYQAEAAAHLARESSRRAATPPRVYSPVSAPLHHLSRRSPPRPNHGSPRMQETRGNNTTHDFPSTTRFAQRPLSPLKTSGAAESSWDDSYYGKQDYHGMVTIDGFVLPPAGAEESKRPSDRRMVSAELDHQSPSVYVPALQTRRPLSEPKTALHRDPTPTGPASSVVMAPSISTAMSSGVPSTALVSSPAPPLFSPNRSGDLGQVVVHDAIRSTVSVGRSHNITVSPSAGRGFNIHVQGGLCCHNCGSERSVEAVLNVSDVSLTLGGPKR